MIHNLRSTSDPVIRVQVGWMALGLAGSMVLADLLVCSCSARSAEQLHTIEKERTVAPGQR